MISISRLCTILFTAMILLTIFTYPQHAWAQSPPKANGKIVFQKIITPSDIGIWTANPDGSDLTEIYSGTGNEPKWSPDGTKIVFWAQPSGSDDIYTMNADGSNVVNLNVAGSDPNWSPDGSKIVFTGGAGIVVMNADGSNQTRLTSEGQSPAWSPDGSKIVFQDGGNSGDAEIYVMNADGSSPTQLTSGLNGAGHPAWSPDGAKIAFDYNGAIYVMNSDGSSVTQVSNSPAPESSPEWSPDGTKITFQGRGTGGFRVFIINADGSNETHIISNSVNDLTPDWQPLAAYVISGRVVAGSTGLSRTLNLSGTQTASTTTDANGYYTFSGLAPGGNYTVTPVAVGQETFTPASYTFDNLSGNQTANFAETPPYTISGRVTAAGGPVLGGVTITLSGSETSFSPCLSLSLTSRAISISSWIISAVESRLF